MQTEREILTFSQDASRPFSRRIASTRLMLIPCRAANARTLFTLGSRINWSKICWRRASERGVGGLKEGFNGNGCNGWVSYPKHTRKTRNRDEPRSLRASSDDLCVCTAYRWWQTTPRRMGPLSRPGPWSEIRAGVPRPPEQQLPQLRKNQPVPSPMMQKTIAVLGRADGDGRREKRKLTCASEKKEKGRKSRGSFRAGPIDLGNRQSSITYASPWVSTSCTGSTGSDPAVWWRGQPQPISRLKRVGV